MKYKYFVYALLAYGAYRFIQGQRVASNTLKGLVSDAIDRQTDVLESGQGR